MPPRKCLVQQQLTLQEPGLRWARVQVLAQGEAAGVGGGWVREAWVKEAWVREAWVREAWAGRAAGVGKAAEMEGEGRAAVVGRAAVGSSQRRGSHSCK